MSRIKAEQVWELIGQEPRPGEKPTQEELNQYNTLAHQADLDNEIKRKTEDILNKIKKIANKISRIITFYPSDSNVKEWFFEDINTVEGFQNYSDEIHEILTSIYEKDTQVDGILKKLGSITDSEVEYTPITLDIVEPATISSLVEISKPKSSKLESKSSIKKKKHKLVPDFNNAMNASMDGVDYTPFEISRVNSIRALEISESPNLEFQSVNHEFVDRAALISDLIYILLNYLKIYNLELSQIDIQIQSNFEGDGLFSIHSILDPQSRKPNLFNPIYQVVVPVFLFENRIFITSFPEPTRVPILHANRKKAPSNLLINGQKKNSFQLAEHCNNVKGAFHHDSFSNLETVNSKSNKLNLLMQSVLADHYLSVYGLDTTQIDIQIQNTANPEEILRFYDGGLFNFTHNIKDLISVTRHININIDTLANFFQTVHVTSGIYDLDVLEENLELLNNVKGPQLTKPNPFYKVLIPAYASDGIIFPVSFPEPFRVPRKIFK